MMNEKNQEGYRSLDWIMNESDQGLFLVVADERIQSEMMRFYERGAVEVYDCRQHPGEYFFRNLQEWVNGLPKTKSFMIADFHMALQDEESIRRLNFSRDMLDRLGKNLIFFVTPHVDDQLANSAYDFYSFLKLRITFHADEAKRAEAADLTVTEDEGEKETWRSEDFKQKMGEANALMKQACDETDQAHYDESEKLLLKAWKMKQYLLEPEHLEMAEIYHELAGVYEKQARYTEAEELYQKGLKIRERVQGVEHPDTAASYSDLANLYSEKARYKEAEELYEKSLRIRERILGEEHPDTVESCNRLAWLYVRQGKRNMASKYFFRVYSECNPEGDFEQWLEDQMKNNPQAAR